MARVIREKYRAAAQLLLFSHRFQRVWEWFSVVVLGLNSFILLYHRSTREAIQYIVCAGATGYFLVVVFQTILYRHQPESRMRILKLSQKAFRLIYTAIYLTSVMLNILTLSQVPDRMNLMAYYGLTFVWIAAWGTNCFWLNRLTQVLKRLIKRTRSENG